MIDAIELSSLPILTLKVGGGMTVGAIAGYCYFLTLWRSVVELQRCSPTRALLMFALRFAALAIALLLLAKSGALPLLSGAAGILIARQLLTRRLGEPS
ncbi:MAG: ATP synthase subunit I [Methylocystis sp.]